jgi:hypothetical protein
MIINKTNNVPQGKLAANSNELEKKSTAALKQKICEKDKFYIAQNCDVSVV